MSANCSAYLAPWSADLVSSFVSILMTCRLFGSPDGSRDLKSEQLQDSKSVNSPKLRIL